MRKQSFRRKPESKAVGERDNKKIIQSITFSLTAAMIFSCQKPSSEENKAPPIQSDQYP
jgi:hypothetical protein